MKAFRHWGKLQNHSIFGGGHAVQEVFPGLQGSFFTCLGFVGDCAKPHEIVYNFPWSLSTCVMLLFILRLVDILDEIVGYGNTGHFCGVPIAKNVDPSDNEFRSMGMVPALQTAKIFTGGLMQN